MSSRIRLSLLLAAVLVAPLALPSGALAASLKATDSVTTLSISEESAASATLRRHHRKKAKHHRKKAKHHRAMAAHHRKRAKHLRTWELILRAESNDTVLEGNLGKLADKLAKSASQSDTQAELHEGKAATHTKQADAAAELGAPNAAFGVDAAAVQAAHHTGKPAKGAALLVRRGGFVRMGLEVGEGCVNPGFLLRDVATDTTLSLPLLDRADGLALTAANAAALAALHGTKGDQVDADVAATLSGKLSSNTLTQETGEKFAEMRGKGMGPFYSVTVERLAPPVDINAAQVVRAAVALWLPGETPFGAYDLSFACDGIARTQSLPLVVLFNPYASTTGEYVADKAALAQGLAQSEQIQAGPLRLPFKIQADWEARDAALQLTSKLPLSARAHAALVARLGQRGPIQLTGRATYSKSGDDTKSGEAAAVVAEDVKAWNDATGHFDLWDGGGTFRTRPGRWSTHQQAVVIFGSGSEEYTVGAKQGPGKGLVGAWTFDDAIGQDTSGVMNKGVTPTTKPKGLVGWYDFDDSHALDGLSGGAWGVGKSLPKHTGLTVEATVHFVDDWQGETAFLKVGTSSYDSAFVAGELNAVTKAYPQGSSDEVKQLSSKLAASSKATKSAYADGKKPWEWTGTTDILATARTGGDARVKYGQCWVFAGLSVGISRSAGIPVRTVTNFDSAHEKAGMPAGVGPHGRAFTTVRKDGTGESQWNFHVWNEVFVKSGGDPKRALGYLTWNTKVWENDTQSKSGGESVWNFHVWTEVFTRTSGDDKSKPSWNAIDGTPQERSEAWEATAVVDADAVKSGGDIDGGPALLLKRNPGVWLYPGSLRLHVRSGTHTNWNDGKDPK